MKLPAFFTACTLVSSKMINLSKSDLSLAAASAPLVRFEGVSKSYDGVVLVVEDLDLDVKKGEFLTLLGPSGSGKTTVLMMLAGFEVPTYGQIMLDGRPITRVPPHKRDIGMVFQNYALFPHMTVAENLGFPLKVRNVSNAEIAERVARALALVRLDGFAQRRPNQLSGGQQQRIALARALIFEPKLVLMDEPLGALDKNLREEMQFEIKHLHERLGVTVVYVTHDQGEALTMSDRVAVFHRGRIQQICTPADIYERPETSFVAGFIGENNGLRAAIRTIDGKECVTELSDGQKVRAINVTAGAAGDEVMLTVRPERVAWGKEAEKAENSLTGHVLEVSYHGDHVRLRLTVAGNADFMVKTANKARSGLPALGDRIQVGWSAEDCRALNHDEGEPVP